MSTVHQLARALGAKRSGRQWVCRCPAHDDRNPSLIFWQGHSAIRFKCYSGCSPEDVLAALRRRGLLDDHGRTNRPDNVNSTARAAQNGDGQKPEDDEAARKFALAQRTCKEAVCIEGTPGALFLHKRAIDITLVPDFGGLRWHAKCPWGSDDTAPCIVARFTDAITGKPRGIWRRPIDGREPKIDGARADGRMCDPAMAG